MAFSVRLLGESASADYGGESGSENGENDDDDDLENIAPLRLAVAQADSDAHDLCDPSIPDSVQHAKALHHMSRMSALMADLEDAEELEEQLSQKPRVIVPSIVNLLNPAPPSNRPSEHAKVISITTLNRTLDVAAVVRLRKSHDRNSGILSEKSFEQKAKYSHYEPKDLARVTAQLNSAAGLDMSEGNGVARPNEIQHVLRHSIHTNDDLQLLMHKRQGGYSRVERWMGTKANPAHDNGGGSSSASIGNWATAKQLIAAVPRLEDNLPGITTRNVNDISPLAIGSFVIMQCLQGRYIGEVVCMYKKNGSGKGTQHESVLFAGTKDVLSLTNLGLRVFVQTHPEENENSFQVWHYSKSTGHLWTLASIKELVYNLGTSALSVSDDRYHTLKPWAFERQVLVLQNTLNIDLSVSTDGKQLVW
ncbi:hypothetical protein BD769DRAFT_1679530 [Suillus cothurnatus]|nr:hypothetical protein BD769DRAFT_1679530 [Suillus cothurnatus]